MEAAVAEGIPVGSGAVRKEGRRQRNAPKTERVGVASGLVREHPGVSLGELFAAENQASGPDTEASVTREATATRPVSPGLWLALDTLQDPQNVGAIFRTAGFFGIRGIVLSRDRSAPLNGTVYDVSAGGVEAVPFCVVPNLSRALDQARKHGLWRLGTSERAKEPLESILPDRPWLVVLGNEEKGLRRLTLDNCDVVCGIPSRGAVTSLNVSVAAAVVISHLT